MSDDVFEARFRRVCATAGLDPTGTPRRAVSYSNDAWTFDDRRHGPVVLRICWRGDRTRIAREATLTRALPDAVHGPEVLDHGGTAVDGETVTWSLARRLDGWSLDRHWPGMTAAQRDSAVDQLAGQMRALHQWVPPEHVTTAMSGRGPRTDDDADWAIGVDLLPLPLSRLTALLPRVRATPGVDLGLVDAAVDAVRALARYGPVLDDPAAHGMAHHDLHQANLWWTPDGTLVLLDWEFARIGPPDLELLQLCENAETDALLGADAQPALLRALTAAYPELVSGRDLTHRLRLYAMAYALRHIAIWPPDGPADTIDPYHPVRRLRRMLDGNWPTPGALPQTLTP